VIVTATTTARTTTSFVPYTWNGQQALMALTFPVAYYNRNVIFSVTMYIALLWNRYITFWVLPSVLGPSVRLVVLNRVLPMLVLPFSQIRIILIFVA